MIFNSKIQVLNSIYKKKHLKIKHGIPVFSSDDFYTKNYQQISKDHVTHYEKYKKNPFMDPDYVKGLNSFTKTIVNKFLKTKVTYLYYLFIRILK